MFFFLRKKKCTGSTAGICWAVFYFSCLVPLVSFTVSQKSSPVLQSDYFAILNQPENVVSPQVFTASSVSTVAQVDYIVPVAWTIYALVSFLLFTRFVRNIYSILSVASKNKNHFLPRRQVGSIERVYSKLFISQLYFHQRQMTMATGRSKRKY
jgi:hypothetical protein